MVQSRGISAPNHIIREGCEEPLRPGPSGTVPVVRSLVVAFSGAGGPFLWLGATRAVRRIPSRVRDSRAAGAGEREEARLRRAGGLLAWLLAW
jgi:hypothetical protein